MCCLYDASPGLARCAQNQSKTPSDESGYTIVDDGPQIPTARNGPDAKQNNVTETLMHCILLCIRPLNVKQSFGILALQSAREHDAPRTSATLPADSSPFKVARSEPGTRPLYE